MGMKEDIYGKNLEETAKLRRGCKDTQITDIKCLNNLDNNDGVVTHLLPNILDYKVKCAIGSIAMNKASGGNGIPVELLKILKVDAHFSCREGYTLNSSS